MNGRPRQNPAYRSARPLEDPTSRLLPEKSTVPSSTLLLKLKEGVAGLFPGKGLWKPQGKQKPPSQPEAPLQNSLRQSMWMLLGGLLFAFGAQCVKLGSANLGFVEMTLYRSLGGLVILFSLAQLHKKPLRTSNPGAHLWRGIFGFISMVLYFYTLGKLPTATAYALNYTSPVFFIIFSALFWREPLSPRLMLAMAGCFAGVLFLLRPTLTPEQIHDGLLGLLSGFLAGLAYCHIRNLGVLGEGGTRTVFYFSLFSTCVASIILLVWGGLSGLSVATVLPMVGLILFATGGQLALTRALHHGRSNISAIFAFSGIVFTVLLDNLVLGIKFAPADYWGFTLIVLCGGTSMLLVQKQRQ